MRTTYARTVVAVGDVPEGKTRLCSSTLHWQRPGAPTGPCAEWPWWTLPFWPRFKVRRLCTVTPAAEQAAAASRGDIGTGGASYESSCQGSELTALVREARRARFPSQRWDDSDRDPDHGRLTDWCGTGQVREQTMPGATGPATIPGPPRRLSRAITEDTADFLIKLNLYLQLENLNHNLPTTRSSSSEREA